MSLVSTGSSSLYSTPEEKQAQEVRRLRKDLSEAQQKVNTLNTQISTNVSTPRIFSVFQHLSSYVTVEHFHYFSGSTDENRIFSSCRQGLLFFILNKKTRS